MRTISVLFVSVVLAICASNLASSYKVDYTNGHNKIHFENNRFLNGKPVNEPKVEEAIETLSKLGFKPDNAKVITETEQIEQQRQQMAQHQQTNNRQQFQHQQMLQQQHQQFMQQQQQLQMQKRMPNMGAREGIVNLSMRRNADAATAAQVANTDAQAAKPSELQELAGAKANTAQNFQPTMDSITHQNQNNKAYEKILSMKNYLPYFRAKYGLGDDFVDPLSEQIEEQNELLAVPLFLNAARENAHQRVAQNGQAQPETSGTNGVRPLSYNGGYQYQQAQPSYAPQQPQQYYQPPKPQYGPAKQSYSTNTGSDTDTSDIFITNINENYNNLNNTETENTIAKSNGANFNRNV